MEPLVLLAAPGFEEALIEELGQGTVVEDGVVEVEASEGAALPDPMFGRQLLPSARFVRGRSVRALAEGAFEVLAPRLDSDDAPWSLDVIVPDDPESPWRPHVLGGRSELVKEELLSLFSKRLRRTSRRRIEKPAQAPLAAQVLLIDRERVVASVARRAILPGGALWPSPFPAGRAPISEDRRAPSRAYKKLLEALSWIGRGLRPGDRCIDLGAAPGSWTYVGMHQGAEIVAVDRAELDPAVLGHPKVRQVRGDAFTYEPEDPPVDWLWSDIIADPEKSRALLLRWAEAGWFKHVIFHLKFKGKQDYASAREALLELRRLGYLHLRSKHLVYDKNEVTIFG